MWRVKHKHRAERQINPPWNCKHKDEVRRESVRRKV